MAKLRSVETALRAESNSQFLASVDVFGVFQNLIQPLFPYYMENLAVVLSFSELLKKTTFEIRVNSPTEDLISKTQIEVINDPMGAGIKILNLEHIKIINRGLYTVDVFEVLEDKSLKFLDTSHLFVADFLPQREFSKEEYDAILNDDSVIKLIKTEFTPIEFVNDEKVQPLRFQVSLDKNAPLQEGHIRLPEDDMVTIMDKTFCLTGIRRQLEWMFGQPLPPVHYNPSETEEDVSEEDVSKQKKTKTSKTKKDEKTEKIKKDDKDDKTSKKTTESKLKKDAQIKDSKATKTIKLSKKDN